MYQYVFYTKKLVKDLDEKSKELALEENAWYEAEKSGCLYTMKYELSGEKEKCDENLAHVISDVIQKQAILEVCDRSLKQKEGLTALEQREIREAFFSNNYLSRQEGFSYVTYYLLYLPILYEIREHQGFNIDGWLAFRMNKYRILLGDLLEQFVKDYLSKKEAVSFIRLMREITFLAVPLEEEMHLVYSLEGKAMLYDRNKKNVTGHYIKKYCKELLLDSTLTREDLLLHILMTICPKRVMVHHKERIKDKKLVNTLEIIFDENVIYCTGCDFCRLIQ